MRTEESKEERTSIALMWAATMTRPDIANAVRATAKFCENPGVAHKQAVVKILRYLLRTADLGITYGRQNGGIENGRTPK